MGDYTKQGQKIGTCGAGYYATLEMLKNHVDKFGKVDDAHYYINPENKCSFAFPFPEYDGKEIGEISNFHEGERVDFFFKFKGESHHKEIVTHVHPKGGQGINIFSPCVYSDRAKISRNLDTSKGETFRLTEQCFYNGELCICAECIYCGAKNIFSKEEAQELAQNIMQDAERLLKDSNNNYYHESDRKRYKKESIYIKEIAKRILKTYNIIEVANS